MYASPSDHRPYHGIASLQAIITAQYRIRHGRDRDTMRAYICRAGVSRRKAGGMKLANTTKKISHKLVRETTKKIVAREKAEEIQRKAGLHPEGAQEGESSVHAGQGRPHISLARAEGPLGYRLLARATFKTRSFDFH